MSTTTTYNSTEEALQVAFDRIALLSQRVWELEKRKNVADQAIFHLVCHLAAGGIVDANATRQKVENQMNKLTEQCADASEQIRENIAVHAAGVVGCFPAFTDDLPPKPQFTVIDGGKS